MKVAQLNSDYSQQLVASGTVGSSTGGDVSGPLPGPITVVGIGGVTVDAPDGIYTDYLNGAGHWTVPAGGGSGFVTNVGGGKEVINTIAASGASHTLDLALGNVQDITLTAACTLAFTGATAGVFCSFELFLRQDGTGGWATTWPGSVIWPGGTAPVLSTTPSTVTVLAFGSEDGGTTWYGFPSHGGALLNPATLPEIASPSTPGSGNVYLYAKSDGRVYSKSPGGIEYGPFDVAGAGGLVSPADFRLSGVRDDPTSIPAGAYGSEFEYTSKGALTAVWALTNSLADYYVNGSSILFSGHGTSGRGFVFQLGSNLPTDFEVAVLLSGAPTQGGMNGLAIVDSSGTGIGCSPYPVSTAYTWDVTTYVYSATRTGGLTPTAAQTMAPHWLALRRQSSTSWRFRWSPDGTTWNTIVAADTKTVTNAQGIFIGSMYNNDPTDMISIHRIVYGTPDLGL
jgi:hypothetical protein